MCLTEPDPAPTPLPYPGVRDEIREFILQNLAHPKGIPSFTDDEPLMETGVMDSLDVFRLVSFLEDQCGVRVEDEDISSENLRNLNTVEELVIRKRGGNWAI